MGMVKPRPVDTCSSYPPLLHLCMADLHILRLCSWSCGSSTNLESLRRCSCFPGSLDQLFEGIDHDGSQGIPKKVLLSGDVPKDAFRILAVDWGKLIPPHPLPPSVCKQRQCCVCKGVIPFARTLGTQHPCQDSRLVRERCPNLREVLILEFMQYIPRNDTLSFTYALSWLMIAWVFRDPILQGLILLDQRQLAENSQLKMDGSGRF